MKVGPGVIELAHFWTPHRAETCSTTLAHRQVLFLLQDPRRTEEVGEEVGEEELFFKLLPDELLTLNTVTCDDAGTTTLCTLRSWLGGAVTELHPYPVNP